MTQKHQQRRGLGRGLGSLIPTAPRPEENGAPEPAPAGADGTGLPHSADWIGAMGEPGTPAPEGDAPAEGDLRPVEGAYFAELPVTAITPNPRQPRQVFDEDAMAELVHSVK